jgi:hypothetical protein
MHKTYGARCHGVAEKLGPALSCQRSTITRAANDACRCGSPLFSQTPSVGPTLFSLYGHKHMHEPPCAACTLCRTSGHTRSHALPRAVCIPRRTSGRTRSHAFPHKKNRCMSRLTPTARRSFFSWQSRGGVSPSRQSDALNEAYRLKKKPYVKKVFRLYSYLFSSRHEGMHNFLHQI